MTKLMIIESPNKIKKLKSILGSDYEIAASFGHIRDLPINQLGITPPNFNLEYVVTDKSKATVAKLRSLAKVASEVILATDPDREGESISWHLNECLKLKSHKRVAFGEITEKAVKSALANHRQIDLKLVEAQEARRGLDRLVGYMVSPKLSDAASEKLTAGRVQSPAVRLVVDRERLIQAFKVTQHYGVLLHFVDDQQGKWVANWQTSPDFTNDENPYLIDRTIAEQVAKVRRVTVESYEESQVKRSPPAGFTTSTFQQAASVALNFDPQVAMGLAQKLFEAGHITYHRTDNPNLSSEALPAIKAIEAQIKCEVVSQQRIFAAPEGAQTGHPAMTPTHWEVEIAGGSEQERAIYKLIRNRAIASQLVDAVYAVRTAKLNGDIEVNGVKTKFVAKGRTLIKKGWLALTAGDQASEDDEAEPDNPVPKLTNQDTLAVDHTEVQSKVTKPPPRYTKASLIKKMESEGIGRPSTYASIMSTIEQRGYVTSSKKYLVPTTLGYTLIDALVGNFNFIELNYTKLLEKDLDLIADGKKSMKTVLSSTYDGLNKDIEKLKKISSVAKNYEHFCPECAAGMVRKPGKYGHFWACSAYPECKTTMQDKDGKPTAKVPEKPQQDSDSKVDETPQLKFPCPLCHKPLKQRTGPRGAFWGCTGYPECKATMPDDNGKPGQKAPEQVKQTPTHFSSKPIKPKAKAGDECPECKKGKLIGRMFKENNKAYIGCDQFPTCRFFAWPEQ